MSSKSRKHSPPKGAKRKPIEDQAGTSMEPGVPSVEDFQDDELIRAPKETSKWRFVLMVLLLIVLLIIFVIPAALLGVTGGGTDPSATFVSWKAPSGEATGMTGYQFGEAKQKLDTLFLVHPFMRGRMNVVDRTPSDADTARVLILDELAQSTGIAVTDEELRDELTGAFEMYASFEQFGGPKNIEEYKSLSKRYGAAGIEETLRRCLRAERVMSILGGLAAQPDPAEIEKAWNAQYADLDLDYVSVNAEGMREAAKAELPDDAGLEAWLNEKDTAGQLPYKTPEMRSLTRVSLDVSGVTPQALVDAFPASEEEAATLTDPAGMYYGRVFYERFKRPEPAEGEEPPTDEEGNPLGTYLSQDEVQAELEREAPVYFALQRWNKSLNDRVLAGETIDLAAEAAQYGLTLTELDPMSREDLSKPETAGGGIGVAARAFQSQANRYFNDVVVAGNELSIYRVNSIVESALPPFFEIKDKLAEDWLDQRAGELVDERLESIRSTFPEYTPTADPDANVPARTGDLRTATADAWSAAVDAAGLTSVRRAGCVKGARQISDWPDAEADDIKFLFANRFALGQMDVDEVSQVLNDGSSNTKYLVRIASSSNRPIAKMKPAEYTGFEAQAARQAAANVVQGMDEDYLAAQFDLKFNRPEPETEEEGDTGE